MLLAKHVRAAQLVHQLILLLLDMHCQLFMPTVSFWPLDSFSSAQGLYCPKAVLGQLPTLGPQT